MSWSSFGSALGDTFLGAVRRRHEREQDDRMAAAKALHEQAMSDKNTPEEQKSYFDSFLKTVGVKKNDASTAGNHFSLLQKLHGAGTPPASRTTMADMPTNPSATGAAPASPAPVSAPAGDLASATGEVAPAPVAPAPAASPATAPTAPKPAPIAGPTPASPMPQAPKSMAPAAPDSLGDMPTIGSSTGTQVSDVSELPLTGRFHDPNNQLNVAIRTGNAENQLGYKKAQLGAQAEREGYKAKTEDYRSTFPDDPKSQKEMQSGLQTGAATRIGVPAVIHYNNTPMTGADLKNALGSDTLPDGSPITDAGSYLTTLRAGQIIDAHERAAPSTMRLAPSTDGTGFEYRNAQGQSVGNVLPPAGYLPQARQGYQWQKQNDGSFLQLPTGSTTQRTIPGQAQQGAPAPAGAPAPISGAPGRTSGIPPMPQAPASLAPRTSNTNTSQPGVPAGRAIGTVIPATGMKPLTAEQALSEGQKSQSQKSAIGLVADVASSEKDLNAMAGLISGGMMELAIDPGTGKAGFVISSLASHALSPEQQVLAGKLQHLNESINTFRNPMGGGGFRGEPARQALIATKGKLGAAKIQTKEVLKQLMIFATKQIAIQDKTLAKAQGLAQPKLDIDTARAYKGIYGTTEAAIKAATAAGYDVSQ